MATNIYVQSRVCQHLASSGYSPRESARFASLVSKWLNANGPEWTVERLKGVKQVIKDSLEKGNFANYKVPPGWATRRNRHGQVIFKDGLVHRVVTVLAEGNLKQALSFCNIQKIVVLDKLSDRQKEKMVKAIESPPVSSINEILEFLRNYSHVRKPSISLVREIEEEGRECPPMLNRIGGSKSAPKFVYDFDIVDIHSGTYSAQPRYDKSYTRTQAECFDWCDYFTYDEACRNLWSKYPGTISSLLVGVDTLRMPEDRFADVKAPLPAGTLSLIQEGGAKLRWIANPIYPLQALGEPMKLKLYKFIINCYPEVKTHNQEEGHNDVLQWLESGRKVWSFDCSSFTDRFPLAYQHLVLGWLRKWEVVDDFDLDAFDCIISKSWFSKALNREVSWAVGQPLGYNPSFHLATLTHAVVLDTLDTMRTGLWRVVGDDVVISDEHLASRYQWFMRESGVEINLSKSLISNQYAEFLGKLITAKEVTPSMKVKFLVHEDQIVQNLLFYGPRALKFMKPSERRASLKVFLPHELGGLGWKPSEVSYSEWVRDILKTEQIALKLQEKALKEFLSLDTFDVDLETQFHNLKSLILQRNVPEPYEVGTFDVVLAPQVNQLSGLPVSELPRKSGDSLTNFGTFNTYIYVIDMLAKWVFSSENPSLDNSDSSPEIVNSTKQWLMRALLDRRAGQPNEREKETNLLSQSHHFESQQYEEFNSSNVNNRFYHPRGPKGPPRGWRISGKSKPERYFRSSKADTSKWFK